MPVWFAALLWKVLLPDIILWLQHHGYFNSAETLAANGAVFVAKAVKAIKTDPSYPNGKNNPFSER